MRRLTTLLLTASLVVPALAGAENHFNVNVNLGAPVPPPPPPVRQVQVQPRVFFEAPPLFLAPSRLGFYVGVDMPNDMVLISGVYYLFQGNQWYRANNYNGPWAVTRYEQLPQPVRQYKIEKIRSYRDHEYRRYHDNREHYRGKYFRPGKENKERLKEDKRERHEERKQHGNKHHRDDD